jgi:uncharacterized RDD family membrane protein YckC
MGASTESRVGFGLRLFASVLDVVFMLVGGFVIGGVFGGVLGSIFGGTIGTLDTGTEAMSGAQAGGIIGFLMGALIALPVFGTVYALLEAFTGATVGKMILGIKIGDANGTKAGLGKLFVRYILKNGAFFCALLAGLIGVELFNTIGGIWSLIWFLGCFLVLTQARQGLHDKIVGTAVYPSKVLR